MGLFVHFPNIKVGLWTIVNMGERIFSKKKKFKIMMDKIQLISIQVSLSMILPVNVFLNNSFFFLFNNLIITTIKGKIWILDIFVKYTKKCQFNYKVVLTLFSFLTSLYFWHYFSQDYRKRSSSSSSFFIFFIFIF